MLAINDLAIGIGIKVLNRGILRSNNSVVGDGISGCLVLEI
jgi:hypothetical protein